ncbi:hypothetical protein HPB47_027789 [Ixodes persulcatus]|uniref:Uncharacterized protein n=1 Tax=Ixodes persulcatus TaxID=34615 RepID=A0AC60PWX5_IXOPE|nr:hypothetical protein HPB47_027789 [Ixodes persulcatus]
MLEAPQSIRRSESVTGHLAPRVATPNRKRVKQQRLSTVLRWMLSRLQELQKLCQVGMSALQATVQTVVPALHVAGCPGTSVAELPLDILEQAVAQATPLVGSVTTSEGDEAASWSERRGWNGDRVVRPCDPREGSESGPGPMAARWHVASWHCPVVVGGLTLLRWWGWFLRCRDSGSGWLLLLLCALADAR